MLDHTLVVWLGELADGSHGFEKWPAVTVGGEKLGYGLKTGQLVHFPSDIPIAAWSWRGELPSMGQPHQKLLSTIARAMGLKNSSGGAFDRMPIESLLGKGGQTVDCTGVVEELFI